MNKSMIALVRLANELDKAGYRKEAEQVDTLLIQAGKHFDQAKKYTDGVVDTGMAQALVSALLGLAGVAAAMNPVILSIASAVGLVGAGTIWAGLSAQLGGGLWDAYEHCAKKFGEAFNWFLEVPKPAAQVQVTPPKQPAQPVPSKSTVDKRKRIEKEYSKKKQELKNVVQQLSTARTQKATIDEKADPAKYLAAVRQINKLKKQVKKLKDQTSEYKDLLKAAIVTNLTAVANDLETRGLFKEASTVRNVVRRAFFGKIWEKIKGGAGAIKKKLSELKNVIPNAIKRAEALVENAAKTNKATLAAARAKVGEDKLQAIGECAKNLLKLANVLKSAK